LWLPALLADFARFWISLAAGRLAHIASFATLHRSVLTGAVETPTGLRLLWFATVGGVFRWGSYFIGIALFTLALGCLARSLPRFETEIEHATDNDEFLDLSDPQITTLTSNAEDSIFGKLDWSLPRQWIRCSALVVLSGIFAIAVGSLLSQALPGSVFHGGTAKVQLTACLIVLIAVLIAVMPIRSFIAVNLVPVSKQNLSTDAPLQLERPRLFAHGVALALGAVYWALWICFGRVFAVVMNAASFLRNPLPANITSLIGSLAIAVPFIPAMIALILTAYDEQRVASQLDEPHRELPIDNQIPTP
jgi:hypothetical protein